MNRKIYRYLVPVDDQRHEVELRGDLLAVGCRSVGVVEFWAIHDEQALPRVHTFTVVGTGHSVPDGRYRGTATTPDGQLVWHLFELTTAPPAVVGHDPGQ